MAGNKFAGGYGGGGSGNINNLMKQAQKMQQDMLTLQEELKERTYTAASGGGMVSATIKGTNELLAIEIKPEAVDPDDVEMLQDMIIAAVNAAMKEADEASSGEMAKITGGMNMPGMF